MVTVGYIILFEEQVLLCVSTVTKIYSTLVIYYIHHIIIIILNSNNSHICCIDREEFSKISNNLAGQCQALSSKLNIWCEDYWSFPPDSIRTHFWSSWQSRIDFEGWMFRKIKTFRGPFDFRFCRAITYPMKLAQVMYCQSKKTCYRFDVVI